MSRLRSLVALLAAAAAVLVAGPLAEAGCADVPYGFYAGTFNCTTTPGCAEGHGGDEGCYSVESAARHIREGGDITFYSIAATAADYRAGIVPTLLPSYTPTFDNRRTCLFDNNDVAWIPSGSGDSDDEDDSDDENDHSTGWCVNMALSPADIERRIEGLPAAARDCEALAPLRGHAASLYLRAECNDVTVCPYAALPLVVGSAGAAHIAVTALCVAGLAAWAAARVRGLPHGWERERRWLAGVHAASVAHAASAAALAFSTDGPGGPLLSQVPFAVLALASAAALAASRWRRAGAVAARVTLAFHAVAVVLALDAAGSAAVNTKDEEKLGHPDEVGAFILLTATCGALYVVNAAWFTLSAVHSTSSWAKGSGISRPVLYRRACAALLAAAAAVCAGCVGLAAVVVRADYGVTATKDGNIMYVHLASSGVPVGAAVALLLLPVLAVDPPFSACRLRVASAAAAAAAAAGAPQTILQPLLTVGSDVHADEGEDDGEPSKSHLVESLQATGPFLMSLAWGAVGFALAYELNWTGSGSGVGSAHAVYAAALVANALVYVALQFSVADARDTAAGAGVPAEPMPAGLAARLAWLGTWHNVHRIGAANSVLTLCTMLAFVARDRGSDADGALTPRRAAPLIAASVVTLLSSVGALVQRRWPAWKVLPVDDTFRCLTLLKSGKVVLKGMLLSGSGGNSSLEAASLVLFAGSSVVLVLVTFTSVAPLWREPGPLAAGPRGGARSGGARALLAAYVASFALAKTMLVLVAVLSAGVELPCGDPGDEDCGGGVACDANCSHPTDVTLLVLSLLLIFVSYINNESCRWLNGVKRGAPGDLGTHSSTLGVSAMERVSVLIAGGGLVALFAQNFSSLLALFILPMLVWVARTVIYAWALQKPVAALNI